jgi:hypothetical protein
MQLTLNIPDETADRLRARGLEISVLVEEMLAKEAYLTDAGFERASVSSAIDRIVERRKGITLGDMKVRDLIDEGRRY